MSPLGEDGRSDLPNPSRPGSGRVAAFFDMDKTLIAENSGSIYMKRRFERGEIDSWELARALLAYFQYKVGVLDILAWTQAMTLDFEGQREVDLESEGRTLYEEAIAGQVYPEARSCIRAHQERGDLVCIVSGTTKFLVEPLAEDLQVKHVVHTRLEARDGILTGRVLEPVCFEEGKVHLLEAFIEEERIDLARSWFYTDSVTDRPLLEVVGHPMIVNPDPRLYRLALRRRWPIRFFDLMHDGRGVTPELLESEETRRKELSASQGPSGQVEPRGIPGPVSSS